LLKRTRNPQLLNARRRLIILKTEIKNKASSPALSNINPCIKKEAWVGNRGRRARSKVVLAIIAARQNLAEMQNPVRRVYTGEDVSSI
jgi:hypothetical protein